jgi:hypothetical protein
MFQLEQVSSVEPYQVSQGCISMLALQKCARNVSQELTTWVCNVSETEAIHVKLLYSPHYLSDNWIYRLWCCCTGYTHAERLAWDSTFCFFNTKREDKSKSIFSFLHIILFFLAWHGLGALSGGHIQNKHR